MAIIRVTAEELQTISGQLTTTAANISSENQTAMAKVQGLVGSGWEGAASEQFNQLFTQWKQSADQIQQSLDGISRLLGKAGTTYTETEDAIKRSLTS